VNDRRVHQHWLQMHSDACWAGLRHLIPLKTNMFKHFWPRTGLTNIYEGVCRNCGQF
jgi:hypothetical protein